ncbi:MAG: ABC transporter substrate-binding protein [Acutalibacteraceae bacterium]
MKKILCIMLSLFMALGLAACATNSTTDTPTSESTKSAELTKITFALDWTPNTNHTGLYVAKEKGYFEQAGLDVDIVFLEESSSASLCASGKAQFAIEAQDTLAAAFTGEEQLGITAVAAILQHNTSGIISRKGDGIDTPKGLEGKTYSTWDSPIELAMLQSLVEKDGGDWSKVNLIPNNIVDEPGALKANQTDSIWVFYGWGCINADVQGFAYDYFFFKDVDSVFDYYTPVIIANNDFLSENPDTAKAFLSAVGKGYAFAASNPDEAAQILIESDSTGSLKGSEELVKKSQAWISGQYIADAEKWGVIDPVRWDAFYDWLNENHLAAKELPHGTGYTNDYLG